MNPYTYKAELGRVVDGDTVDLVVDLGYSLYYRVRFRLARIDAPEVRGSERPDGLKAKAYLHDLLSGTLESIYVQSEKTGKWGRWIGELYIGSILDDGKFDGYSVSDKLVENGYAEYRNY